MQAADPYVGLVAHLMVCVALGAGLVGVSALVRHRAVTSRRVKHDTYECGEAPFGPAWREGPVGFYLIALLFILFDAEAAFLFPWILALRAAGPVALWGMIVFVAVLFVGWVYALRRGDLRWSR